LHLHRLLLLGALAMGVIAGPVGPELGTSTAEARPAARPTKGKASKATRGKPTRSARASSTRERERDRASRVRRGKKGKKRGSKIKLCKDVQVGKGRRARSRKRCTFVKQFQGHGVVTAELRTQPRERPSGEVWVYSENLREEARVNIFRPDGAYDEEALARLDDVFRCRRTQEVRALDPRLYEQLSRMQDHFGKVRATVVSGFRFAERSSSRHFHASAIDIKLEGVPLRDMYGYAQSLDAGGMGMGIYPHSGFIHVDYRAPGEPSYRWTDYSGAGSSDRARRARGKRGKAPGRTARAKRPTS
jgi:uncharacterized protein YcbK (DUF882 family)